MTTIAHISDLHFGNETEEVVDALTRDLLRTAPALVVVSGDLTQRARRKEFIAARSFLDRIPFPRLVVPGNHDIPLFDVLTRFARPLARFRRYINDDVDPFFSNERIAVLGLNTARSNTWKNGRVSKAQIEKLSRYLSGIPEGVMKVVVTHHPFLPLPGDPSPVIVGRAQEALDAAEVHGVDLMLAGHLHVGYMGDVRSHHLGIRRAILVAQAGTATSHRIRNEPNSYNVIELTPQKMGVSLRVWNGRGFKEAKAAEYRKEGSDWHRSDGGPDHLAVRGAPNTSL